MKTFMKTVSLGLYIVAVSASLSMAAEKSDEKSMACPLPQSRQERDMVLSEAGPIINDKAAPSLCMSRLVNAQKEFSIRVGVAAVSDQQIVSEMANAAWKAEVSDIDARDLNH